MTDDEDDDDWLGWLGGEVDGRGMYSDEENQQNMSPTNNRPSIHPHEHVRSVKTAKKTILAGDTSYRRKKT